MCTYIYTYAFTYKYICRLCIRYRILNTSLICKCNCTIPYNIASPFHNFNKLFNLYLNYGTIL